MEVTVNDQVRKVPVTTEDKLEKNDQWRKFNGVLVERNHKEIPKKDGTGSLNQYVFNDEDGNTYETWSEVTDVLLQPNVLVKEPVEMYYEIVDDKFSGGKKKKIVSVKTLEGWQVAGSRQKQKADYSRQAALQAAATVFSSAADLEDSKKILDLADKFHKWLKDE